MEHYWRRRRFLRGFAAGGMIPRRHAAIEWKFFTCAMPPEKKRTLEDGGWDAGYLQGIEYHEYDQMMR